MINYSDKCVKMIKDFEGFRARAYKCLPSEKYYTIGYGHYGIQNPNMVIDENVAETMLRNDMDNSAAAVREYNDKYNYNFNQHEFDALVSFVFNLGNGILSQLTQEGTRSKKEIAAAMLLYVTDGTNVIEGLVTRRKKENLLFIDGVYPFDLGVDEVQTVADEDITENTTIKEIVDFVIAGKFGNGEMRKEKLYNVIQGFVNERYS